MDRHRLLMTLLMEHLIQRALFQILILQSSLHHRQVLLLVMNHPSPLRRTGSRRRHHLEQTDRTLDMLANPSNTLFVRHRGIVIKQHRAITSGFDTGLDLLPDEKQKKIVIVQVKIATKKTGRSDLAFLPNEEADTPTAVF